MTGANLTRRRVGFLALGALAAGWSVVPAQSAPVRSVRLPLGTFTLSRKLARGLRDGKAVVVTREWRIAFAAQSRGMAVTGEQSSVTVEAPPRLAPLARIEEERSTDGVFPILLAPDGIIMAAGANPSRASVDSAMATAQRLLKQNGFSEEAAGRHAAYLAQLQGAGSALLDQWPGDLFFPSTQPFRDVRQVALPDGGTGEFELNWQARAQETSGLLKTARREVITRIGDSERRSVEEWSLVRA